LASDFRQPGRAEAGTGLLEYEAPDANPLRDAMFKPTIPIEGGSALIPSTPGWASTGFRIITHLHHGETRNRRAGVTFPYAPYRFYSRRSNRYDNRY
jgi:hypothetical protein